MHRTASCSVAALCGMLLTLAVPAQTDASADLAKIKAEARQALDVGDFGTASAGYRRVTLADPDDGTAWQLLGYCLHAQGKLDEALPVHQKAAEFAAVAAVASYNCACVYALQGKTDDAFAWLDKAVKAGFDRPEYLSEDGDIASLRKDPRFAEIEKRVAKQARPDKTQVFAVQTDRKCARIAWFNRAGSPGQVAVDYTAVPWHDKYAAMVESPEMLGKRWRLGGDFWTTLDTSVDAEIGGVAVPAGHYYLTLVQREAGHPLLCVHDAAEVKKQRLDPFQAARVQGGIEIPLAMSKGEKVAAHLDLGIHVEKGSLDHATFDVRFGPFVLTAPVLLKVGS